MPTCPICNAPARPLKENGAFPFCSSRCRYADLSRWLDGDYRIPAFELGESDSPYDLEPELADPLAGPGKDEPGAGNP